MYIIDYLICYNGQTERTEWRGMHVRGACISVCLRAHQNTRLLGGQAEAPKHLAITLLAINNTGHTDRPA